MKDELTSGVERSLEPFLTKEQMKGVSESIANGVMSDAVTTVRNDARNVLSVSSNPEDILFIDTVKAFTTIVGTLGAVAALVTSSGFTAVAAGAALVGVLATFRGVKVTLPRMEGLICHLLIMSESKRMYKNDLRNGVTSYMEKYYLETTDMSDFYDALTVLGNLGCVEVKDDEVILKQTIIVRR